jgi:hypothetical protein
LARRLCLRASAATLAALAGGSAAVADVTVNGGDTPIATATASPSGPDNIVQSGTLGVASGPAITLNSNNSVTNSGTIQTQNASGLTGILGLGGNTGSITHSGSINFNQTSTLTTTDSNGVVTGPFATDSDLWGIRVQGPGALSGDINSSGGINIQGFNSAAISVESPLTGSIGVSGAVTVNGDNSFGIRTLAPVGGNVVVAGAVAAAGANTQAISIGGDVGGGLVVESAVSATGYHQTTRSTTTNVLAAENQNDRAQGGAAITVAGSLGKGLLVSAPPITLSSTNPDVNADGIPDASEPTGAVTSFGGAPAIVIGATGRDIQLGPVGTGDSANGVLIEGSVSGQGLRDGVAANGLQIGVNGGGAVSITGGVRVAGSVTATAFSGDATALHLLQGAAAPVLYNTSQITASMTGETQNAASAVVVEPGGSLPVILNAGKLTATVIGSSGSAAAILDRAGSLTHLENTGTISGAVIPATGSTIPVTGTAVAIDDAANTTGLSVVSYQGAGYTIAPAIVGAILMGSGNDSVDIEAGAVTGDLAFGAGANSLTINGGATVTGGVSANGGTLALSVGAGSLQINSANPLNLTSLALGPSSKLVLTADPAAGAATFLNVNGAASIADGAKLGLRVSSLSTAAQTFTLIKATQLNLGALDTSLLATAPYIYNATIASDAAAGTVSLALARKTAAQLDLPGSIAGGYEPVVAAAGANPTLSQALLLPTDRNSFIASYDQLLPEHSGGIFELVRGGVEAFARPLDDRQAAESGAWVQEVNVGVSAGDRNGLPGYRGWGFGLIGGFELRPSRVGVFGVTIGGYSSELRPHDTDSSDNAVANIVEAGGYWRATAGRFTFNARAAADYLMASDHRVVDITSNGQTLFSGTATGNWNGWGINSRLRASYEANWKSLYFRPQVGIDYFRLSEDAYTEGGGGALNLAVGSRETSELAGFAGVAAGALFTQQGGAWGPELLLGYRDVVSKGDGATTARFLSGGDAFTVGPNPISGSGGVARLAFKSESAWGAVVLDGGAEVRDGLTVFDARLAVHLVF